MRIELATYADDHELRAILREISIPGPVQIALDHRRSFFEALRIYGPYSEVIVARDRETRRIAGLGCRSVRKAWINGQLSPLGYLSSLRLLPEYRQGTILARLYRFLQERHQDGRTGLYLTGIVADNTRARRLLTSGRCELPTYHDYGRVCILVISLRRAPRVRSSGRFGVRAATPTDVPGVIHFLRRHGPRRQFFPDFQAADLQTGNGLLQGVGLKDILLCQCGNEILGTVAAWNQKSFRQGRVTGYHPVLRLSRPVYNWIASLRGRPTLPAPGSQPDYYYLSLVCIRDDDPEVFAALVDHLIARHHSRSTLLVAGLHERDPLLPVLRHYRHVSHAACLYVACWEDGEPQFHDLDTRVPYVEMGAF